MNHPTEDGDEEKEESGEVAADNNAEENGKDEGIKPHKNGSS